MPSPQSLLALTNWRYPSFGSPGFGMRYGFGTGPLGYNAVPGDSFGSPGFGMRETPMMATQFTQPVVQPAAPLTAGSVYSRGGKTMYDLINSPASQQVSGGVGKIARTGAGIAGSLLGMTTPVGIGLNILGTGFSIVNAIRSYREAEKMVSPRVPAPEEVKTPYTGVTAEERAYQRSTGQNLYAATTAAGRFLGKDTSMGALALMIEKERQDAAINAQINREAAALGINAEQFNVQQRQRVKEIQAQYDWQTEAMKAGIQAEALQTGAQSILNLGQSFVGMSNIARSYTTGLKETMPDLYALYNEAITSGNEGLMKYFDKII